MIVRATSACWSSPRRWRRTGLVSPMQTLLDAWRAESGYITPKVGVAAAVPDGSDGLLLIKRRDNGLWAMPGGWAEIADTPATGAVREVLEETGLIVRADRLLGLYDGWLHKFSRLNHLYHIVFLCSVVGGTLQAADEVLDAGFFSRHALPPLAPGHAVAIDDAFAALANPHLPVAFDRLPQPHGVVDKPPLS